MRKVTEIFASLTCAIGFCANAQEISQYQYWLELSSADQVYADRTGEEFVRMLNFVQKNALNFSIS